MENSGGAEKTPLLSEEGHSVNHSGKNLPLVDVSQPGLEDWQSSPDGTSTIIDESELGGIHHAKGKDNSSHQLSQWPATAICGNDITSSCLYVIGLCTASAGIYAPLSLLIVAILLYLFRSIYTEVGSALPLNGASYTLLLNTTTKTVSSLAACLTIISYISTAVVSASTAFYYVNTLVCDNYAPACPHTDLIVTCGTIGLLFVFAVLSLIGISESAITALIIFVAHMVTLVLLCVFCLVYAIETKFSLLVANFHAPQPNNIPTAIFLGFAAGMLGITGFESSANFIEQQKPGVFPKTLRNMWVAVAIFNPLISLLSLSVLSLDIVSNPNDPNILSQMARVATSTHNMKAWLQWVVTIDAALVLSGGVLTSYVGVVGLVRRMALDRCLPSFFLNTNRVRGTNHVIIIAFFVICTIMYLVLNGKTDALGGVYTIAFLAVMSLFAGGDMILKYKRGRLPRTSRAMKTVIVIAGSGCLAALFANIYTHPDYFKWFLIYYVCTALVVTMMLIRTKILKVVMYFVYQKIRNTRYARRVADFLIAQIKQINNQCIIYLAKDDNITAINKAILYIHDNELTNWVRIVHVYEDEAKIPERLEENVKTIDRIYPKIRVDYVAVKGHFNPEIIEKISDHYAVPKNLMFISCPGSKFAHNLSDFGGMRIITSDG